MPANFKTPVIRSSKWLAAVRSLEHCVLCGAYGVQAAHRNEGKGLSQKTSDCLTAALCMTCHHELDNGNKLELSERRARMDKAIVLTVEALAQAGLIKVAA